MRKHMLWISLALILVVTLAFNVFAGMGRGGMGRGGGNVGNPGIHCNLTDEQLVQVQPLRAQFLADTAKLRETIVETRTELRSETDPLRRAALRAALAEFQSEFHLARVEHIEAVRESVPEAYTEMGQANHERGMRGDGMKGRGMRGGAGFRAGDCPLLPTVE